jgi:hypothetical protein
VKDSVTRRVYARNGGKVKDCVTAGNRMLDRVKVCNLSDRNLMAPSNWDRISACPRLGHGIGQIIGDRAVIDQPESVPG